MRVKVSVVMCTYNGAAFLEEQIASIVHQSYPVCELIIQDDGSTDNTAEVVERCRINWPQCPIRFYRNEQRMGYTRNFLSAYQRATGDYIASCDQDDVWHPKKIELLLSHIGKHSLIFHRSVMFDEQGRETGHRPDRTPCLHPLYVLLKPQIAGHQQLFSAALLPAMKQISGQQPVTYDYLVCTLAACREGITYINKDLVRWRRYSGSATYVALAQKDNRLMGYWRALCALFDKERRHTTRVYFSLYRPFDFDEELMRVIRWMSSGKLLDVMRAGRLCFSYRKTLYPELKGVRQAMKSFFMPMFFIRDYGLFILKK